MNTLHLPIVFFLMLFAFHCKAQTIEGSVFLTAGDYTLQGVGDVSSPELGNQFHHAGAAIFASTSDRLFFGASVRDWSRFNNSVLSVAPLAKYRVAKDSYRMEVFAGPVLQHRVTTSFGGTLGAEMTIFACSNDLAASIGSEIEVGGRGIFADMYLRMKFDRYGVRIGSASYVGGNYFQVDYVVSEQISFGMLYAWDPAMNQLLDQTGYGDYHRRGLGLQVTARF